VSESLDPPDNGAADESIGALLSRVRMEQGKSQLRVAELLCAASGLATITRHEISRWEREERIPGGSWLRWLAVVLDTPLDELERAAAVARQRRETTMTPTMIPTMTPLPAPATTALTAPMTPMTPSMMATRERWPGERASRRARLLALRRMDDLVAGPELVRLVHRELRAWLAEDPTPRQEGRPEGRPEVNAHAGESGPVDSRAARERLSLIAGLAQLAGWVTADVGAPTSALSAFRLGLRAADRGGDRPLAGHLLGCLAQLTAEDGDPRAALRLARSAQRRAGATASSGVRSLLALRLAYGAAVAGARRDCEEAIAAAERAAQQRDPALDPDWLYWFDEAHFAAMVGRCHVALGRPGPARPLLESALAADGIQLRAAAITGVSLAQAHIDAGDLDAACGAATDALLTCVQSGSVRAAGAVLALDRRLRATAGPGGRPAAMRDYLELISSARPFLPTAGDRPARPARPASATPTGRSTTRSAARSGTPRAGPAPERGDPRSDDLRHRRPSTVQDARQEPRRAGGS
jgi:transcriptional regulator with XRE-family HTH domain